MAARVSGALEAKYTESYKLKALDDMAPYEAWAETFETFFRPDRGVRIPPELLPKRLQFIKGNRLFDYSDRTGFRVIISTRLKELMESIEPEVHQFAPVEIFHKDGSPYGETFWFYVILTVIDAINPEMGGVVKQAPSPWQDPDEYTWSIKAGCYDQLAVHKDRVAGRAMWWDRRMNVQQFFSDALIDGMRAEQMDGWRISEYWPEL